MSTFADELRKPLYAAMTDAEAAAELNAADKTQVFSRFGSYRTLATLLTESEYDVLVSVLDTTAATSRLMADTVKMLGLPGDEQGNGGGIDFGAEVVRTRIDAMQPSLVAAIGGDNAHAEAAALCAKVKGYAERPASTAQLLGATWTVTDTDVRNWREEIANG